MIKAPTFRDIITGNVERLLVEYRDLVAKAARGSTLECPNEKQVEKLLGQLELPRWCFRRDVAAARKWWMAETEYQRRELVITYPHLFTDAREWAERRGDDRARRREVLARLRAAAARGA